MKGLRQTADKYFHSSEHVLWLKSYLKSRIYRAKYFFCPSRLMRRLPADEGDYLTVIFVTEVEQKDTMTCIAAIFPIL